MPVNDNSGKITELSASLSLLALTSAAQINLKL
jgi:hypothetical protein